MGADDLLGAEPVQCRHHRGVREPPLERGRGLLQPGRLGRDDPEVERLELVGVGGRGHAGVQVAAPRDAEPVAVERVGVLASPRQHRDLRDLREVARKQAPDHTSPDHADTLDGH